MTKEERKEFIKRMCTDQRKIREMGEDSKCSLMCDFNLTEEQYDSILKVWKQEDEKRKDKPNWFFMKEYPRFRHRAIDKGEEYLEEFIKSKQKKN